jgi:hypothetical protein
MAPKGIKTSKIIQRKSKAKVVEWVPRERSRGTRYVPVDASTSTGLQTPRRDTARMEIDSHEAALYEADLPSMDVDETLWIEEPVMPEQRRVSPTTFPSSTARDTALRPSVPS